MRIQRAPVAMQLRTGLIISSPSIHKYCSASSNSEPITVALQSSRVSMILNRSDQCVDILLGSSGNLLGRYRKMKATSNEMIVRATGTFTLCASQIWTPEMEELAAPTRSARRWPAVTGSRGSSAPRGRSSPRWSTTRRACSPPTSTWGSSRSPSTSWTRLATTPRRGTCSFSWTRAARSPCSSSARRSCPRASPTRTSSSKFSRISPPGGCGPGRLRAASGRTLRNSNFPGR